MFDRGIIFWVGGAVLLAIAGVLIAILNSGYGELSSRGYELAIATVSACNQRDTERLAEIESLVREAEGQAAISTQEANWLLKIVALGKGGQWQQADRRVRKLMEAQIQSRPSPPTPSG
jgi:hypothetical protein